MWKNKPISDVGALWQAIEPFAKEYDVTRQVISSYNEKGRVDNTCNKDCILAFIDPSARTISSSQSGTGRPVRAEYTLYTVVPHYISIGDVVHTATWGDLKVNGVDDKRYQGMMTATLQRLGTTQQSSRLHNKLYEPE